MDGIIIKDDTRYQYTESYLQSKGHVFHCPITPPEDLDFAIFPFKANVDEFIYNDDFFAALGKNAVVFSGLRSSYLSGKCIKYDISYLPMMEDIGTKVKNAVPTSEGVIAYLIHNLRRTIANSRILVIGYGVCGRDLALRLTALGSNVYALVRNREKECMAQADSVTSVFLHELAQIKFDAVINTVPQQVLTNNMLTCDTLYLEIASPPYGFNMDFAKTLNNRSALLPGIPGKYAVQTAGETLGEYVEFVLAQEYR